MKNVTIGYRVLLILGLFVTICYGENWPNWRGVNNSGLASNTATPPLTWSETEHM